jgi:hypothetical protein
MPEGIQKLTERGYTPEISREFVPWRPNTPPVRHPDNGSSLVRIRYCWLRTPLPDANNNCSTGSTARK